MSTLDIVDFHTHLWPPAWAPGGKRFRGLPGLGAATVDLITKPEALIDAFAANGIALAIISATIESLFGAAGPVDADDIRQANDWLAGLPVRHGGLAALATIDAFSGDAGAREAERAITELGLVGVVVDSARAGRFLGDPVTRPTLETAARLKVPVFVHPVAHPDSDVLIAAAGKLGNSAGRGLMNGVAFLAVLQSSLLDDFPDLDLVFATLGLGAIVQAARGGRFGRDNRARRPRPNLYFDTMGDDPAIVSILTGFFGADRVLAGTDWPILGPLDRATLAANLAAAGLDDADQRLVAGGNARRLLGRRAAVRAAAE